VAIQEMMGRLTFPWIATSAFGLLAMRRCWDEAIRDLAAGAISARESSVFNGLRRHFGPTVIAPSPDRPKERCAS